MQKLLDLAKTRSEEISWVDLPEFSARFPPQSAGAQAALHKRAREFALTAMQELASDTAVAIGSNANGCRPILPLMGSRFVELFHLYDDLTEGSVTAEIAVADSQRSTATSFREGVYQSIGAAALSRLSAARMLVGGDAGFVLAADRATGDLTQGFCSVAALRPPARKALELIRQAAVLPSSVVRRPAITGNPVSIEDLVSEPPAPSGPAYSSPSSGSIRKRLGLLPGYPEFNEELCGGTSSVECISDPGDVAKRLGLTLEDFAEAREYLAEEIVAFSRASEPLNPTSPCSAATASVCVGGLCEMDDGATTGTCQTAPLYKRFGATATPPGATDPTYWAALVSHQTDNARGRTYDLRGAPFADNTGVPVPADWAHFAASAAVTAYYLSLQATSQWPCVGGCTPGDLELLNGVRGPMQLLIEDVTRRGLEQISYCVDNGLTKGRRSRPGGASRVTGAS